MMNMNLKRNRIVIGWLFLTLLFLVPSVAMAGQVSVADTSDITENDTVINFPVTINTADSGSGVTVTLLYSGTATGGGVDYTAPASIIIPRDALNANIAIQIHSDNIVELDETIIVTIDGVSGSVPHTIHPSQNSASAQILNDDAASFSIADAASVAEAGGPSSFVVTLANEVDAASSVTINYDTGDGSALSADNDYAAVAGGTLTFTGAAAGATQTIDVTINDDSKVEVDEDFTVTLSGGADATFTNATATGLITNDDAASFSIADAASVAEAGGPSSFVVTLANEVDAAASVTVNYDTGDGSALSADNDYAAVAGGTLTFTGAAAGATQTIDVTINDDSKVEIDEDFTVTLSGGADATFTNATATGLITNDDAASFSIADAASVAEAGGPSSFVVTLANEVDAAASVTMNYDTGDGSALSADNDYAAVAGGTLTLYGRGGRCDPDDRCDHQRRQQSGGRRGFYGDLVGWCGCDFYQCHGHGPDHQ